MLPKLVLFFQLLLLSYPSFSVSMAQTIQPPRQFDTYVLAMSYLNSFCFSHPLKKECLETLEKPEMVLHGLWPNQHQDYQHLYQYCSISQADAGKDWCDIHLDVRRQMTNETFSSLAEQMPGTQSCLYNHEWYAHGTCSGFSVNDFFGLSANLSRSFNQLKNFDHFLEENFGKPVSRSDLQEALIADLGESARNSLVFSCSNRTVGNEKKYFFSEVDITLDRNSFKSFPKPGSFAPSEAYQLKDGTLKKDIGNCPSSDILLYSKKESSEDSGGILHSISSFFSDLAEKISSASSTRVQNPCPCKTNPQKSFCHATEFERNSDGSITIYKDNGSSSIVPGPYQSVDEFIQDKVCK